VREQSSLLLLGRTGLWLTAWTAAIAACLSIRSWPGNWGHWLCGPWGCGPPLQALVACHSAWLVLLLLPAVVLSRYQWPSPAALRKLGTFLICVAIAVLGLIVARQRLDWWNAAQGPQQEYFWQRCGFIVATTVDMPVVQMLIAGTYLLITSPRASRAPIEVSDFRASESEEGPSTDTH